MVLCDIGSRNNIVFSVPHKPAVDPDGPAPNRGQCHNPACYRNRIIPKDNGLRSVNNPKNRRYRRAPEFSHWVLHGASHRAKVTMPLYQSRARASLIDDSFKLTMDRAGSPRKLLAPDSDAHYRARITTMSCTSTFAHG